MNLRDMKYVAIIAEEKSITKAAARLFIAQPALSQCVQKIEKELGIPIFVRSPSGVTLTEGGRCFIEFASHTLSEERRLIRRIEDLKNADVGEVRIGFTGTQATYVLPNFLPRFRDQFPEIDVVLVEAVGSRIEEMLVKGELEIGILHPPLVHEELESFPLSYDELVIVPRRNSHFQQFISYKDGEDEPYLDMRFLNDEPLVLPHPSLRSRKICDLILSKAGIEPHVRQVCDSINTMDALVQIDFGTGILPKKQLSYNLRRRGYYKIDAAYNVAYTFEVATLKDAYLPAAARKLLELLRQVAGTF